jgi:hypothetical protein
MQEKVEKVMEEEKMRSKNSEKQRKLEDIRITGKKGVREKGDIDEEEEKASS